MTEKSNTGISGDRTCSVVADAANVPAVSCNAHAATTMNQTTVNNPARYRAVINHNTRPTAGNRLAGIVGNAIQLCVITQINRFSVVTRNQASIADTADNRAASCIDAVLNTCNRTAIANAAGNRTVNEGDTRAATGDRRTHAIADIIDTDIAGAGCAIQVNPVQAA